MGCEGGQGGRAGSSRGREQGCTADDHCCQYCAKRERPTNGGLSRGAASGYCRHDANGGRCGHGPVKRSEIEPAAWANRQRAGPRGTAAWTVADHRWSLVCLCLAERWRTSRVEHRQVCLPGPPERGCYLLACRGQAADPSDAMRPAYGW